MVRIYTDDKLYIISLYYTNTNDEILQPEAAYVAAFNTIPCKTLQIVSIK